MVVLEIPETKILLGHDGGDELVIFEDIDRRAFLRIRPIQTSDDGVLVEVINIARQGARRHLQRRKVMTVTAETLDAGMRPVRNVQPLGPRRYGDAVRRLELAVRVALSAENQIIPHCLERIGTQNSRGQDVVEF